MTQTIRAYTMFAMLLLLPACALLTPQPPADKLYVLRAEAPASAHKIGVNLRISEPEAAPGLDTPRIAVLEAPNRLTYYTGAAWAEPLPQMLQEFLVDAFQRSHVFKSVSSDEEDIRADTLLLIDIRDFEVDNSNSLPSVRIRLAVKLVDATSHKIIVSFVTEKNGVADANHMQDIAAAFNVSSNEAASEILRRIGKK